MSDVPELPEDLARVVRMPPPLPDMPQEPPAEEARRPAPPRFEEAPVLSAAPASTVLLERTHVPTAPDPLFDEDAEPGPEGIPAALAAVVSDPGRAGPGGRRPRLVAGPSGPGTVDEDLAPLLPETVCSLFGVRPITRAPGHVTIAMEDPDDMVARTVVQVRMRALGIESISFVPAWAPAPPAVDPGTPEGAATPDAPPSPPIAPPADGTARTGELLLSQGLVTAEQLDDALLQQQRRGGRIGEVLAHGGVVSQDDVARALAAQADLPFVDADRLEIDPLVASWMPARLALRRRVLAWREDEQGVVDVAVSDPFDADLRAQLQERFTAVRLHVAADGALGRALERVHAQEHIEAATSRLAMEHAVNSAATTFSRGQVVVFAIVGLIFLAGLVVDAIATIAIFNLLAGIFYLWSSGFKLILARNSFRREITTPVTATEIAALDEPGLPVFTILMPMYREAAVVRRLVQSIGALDYPRHKLDVKLLLEQDDPETLAAVQALQLPPHFHVVVVPDALPKTKPKACNYGLLLARGDITVIYDAEDEPDPDQLKKVVIAFRKSEPSTVCVQCKLNYYNRTQNLLTRWFTTEYSQWFDIFLPGLDLHDVPIPLGGTSNHFVTRELVELGAWDPYNVAEDADLGIRLTKSGWRTGVVDSTTYEEANPDLHNWIRQRSRWVKGYMQTWLVHMRHPIRLLRTIGLRGFTSFQLTVGGTFFGFLLNPIYWALTSMWVLTEAGVIRQIFPGFVYYLGAFGLVIGNFVFTYLNVLGSMRRGYFDLVKFALMSPLYWALMSWAAWKGAVQLITKPHYWEKTEHGLADNRSDH